MSNIKVGSKVFRNVEKMNFEELTVLRMAMVTEMTKIVEQGKHIPPTIQGRGRLTQLNEKMMQLNRRMSMVDNLAKKIIAQAVPKTPPPETTVETQAVSET
jgi:hypothetical protein